MTQVLWPPCLLLSACVHYSPYLGAHLLTTHNNTVGMAEAQVKAMIAAKDIVVFAWASAPNFLPLCRVHMP